MSQPGVARSLLSPVKEPDINAVIEPIYIDEIQDSEEFRKRRPKLWELERELHCSIIGTCVSPATLRKIYQKVNPSQSAHLCEYDLHKLFVSSAGQPEAGIKILQKYLEKTYASAITRSKKLETEEELETFWNGCVKNGNIAEGYWAVMTHQRVTDKLGNMVFGAVHMFSHLAGRHLQEETVRRNSSGQEVIKLKKALAQKEKTVSRLQKTNASRELECEELLLQVSNQQQCNERFAAQIEKLSSSSALVAANKKIKSLENSLHTATVRKETKNRKVQNKYANTIEYLQETLDATLAKVVSLELQLEQFVSDTAETGVDNENEGDLCGRCVLYVGGQVGSQSGFRALVENRNGKFLYHDGGREDSRQRLTSMLGKADAVICPVSCVSHTATCKIKKVCSRSQKKMIWIKTSSQAAFTSALLELKQDGKISNTSDLQQQS